MTDLERASAAWYTAISSEATVHGKIHALAEALAEVRAEALEEAALECEARFCDGCADAIRALKDKA